MRPVREEEEEEGAELKKEGVADRIRDRSDRGGEEGRAIEKRKTDGGARRRLGCPRIRSLCVLDSRRG